MKVRKLYRMAKNLEHGVWYDKNGIKMEKPILDMPMNYDKNHDGYICFVGSFKELLQYAGLKSILTLLIKGYRIYTLKTTNYKPYNGYYMVEKDYYYKVMKEKMKCYTKK